MWKNLFAISSILAFVSLTLTVSARQTPGDIAAFPDTAAPAAFLCEEDTAALSVSKGTVVDRASDVLENYMLVSDPANTCRHPDVADAAGYDSPGQRCYMMRELGTGEPDLPLACSEAYEGDPTQGAGVASLRCTGWNTRMTAMAGGGFHMNATSPSERRSRVSLGSCRAL